MKLDKKTLRSLSLAFFISGLTLAGVNIFADDYSAQTEETEETENYQAADSAEESTESTEAETNEDENSEPAGEDSSSDAEEVDSSEEIAEENTDTSEQSESTEEEKTTEAEPAEEEERDANDTIEIVVNPNEDSYSVVGRLVESGIVENSDQFNEFLDYYDYARRIQPGTKELSPAMSYEEIAQILTTY